MSRSMRVWQSLRTGVRSWRWWLTAGVVAMGAGLAMLGLTAAVIYPQLPDVTQLNDYHPKLALQVYSSDGVELAAFGAERRYFVPIEQIPASMQNALLAVEDWQFREHSGVSLRGVARAVVTNLFLGRKRQGGSTITQQVARNFFLTSRKTYMRKISEILLALKIERQLSKDQILELYMNQIFLGQKAYGFEAAARVYFGKSLAALSSAECAMLAGLPQNPSYANPMVNLERARTRQLVVLERMHDVGVLNDAQWATAKAEPLRVRHAGQSMHAEYLAEMARQAVFAQYGEKAYTEGFKVHTTLRSDDQQAAWAALRKGVLDYNRRQAWRGPEAEEELPEDASESDIARVLGEHRDDDDLRVAIVVEATSKQIVATLANGDQVKLGNDRRLRRGAIIRVQKTGNAWALTQWPQVEAALVSMEPNNGKVRALVGGFDFAENQFNHVTQAWRQPGSSFKPFLYSAALENGVMPASVINDAPMDASLLGGWDPKNSDDKYEGPMTLRQALAKSKNMVTIRLVQLLGPATARQWAARFGFDLERQPDNLTLALGAGSTTPLQLASAYAVVANGGMRINPLVIERITDANDKVLFQAPPVVLDESMRVIPPRNAFLTASLLQEVTRSGTAARAQAALQRTDIYGKTGTTNDAVDAWFAGFQPELVAVVWMGYDTPQSLGARESGGGLSLPIWIEYMQRALRNRPVVDVPVPEGVQHSGGDWLYSEWADGSFQSHIGMNDSSPTSANSPGIPSSTPGF
ncbi:penicillin-binding protein 1A [Leptothrix ochracea]|uniref:penicillin-binding protein 1A n=1 Tax=Leptothrix ochracea TaxID=735331 RepID=UPI0034E2B300